MSSPNSVTAQLSAGKTHSPAPTHHEVLRVLYPLLGALFAALLSTTVPFPALSTITAELGGGSTGLTWIVTVALLATATSTPIWGALSDLYQTKDLVQVALLTLVGGSLVAACAPTLAVLFVGRALQGIGIGGVVTVAVAVLGALIPPREQGRYSGYAAIVMAIRRVERQLGEGVGDDGDVIGGGVGAGVAGTQQHRDGFAGAILAVIDERAQQVESEAALECRRGGLLVGVVRAARMRCERMHHGTRISPGRGRRSDRGTVSLAARFGRRRPGVHRHRHRPVDTRLGRTGRYQDIIDAYADHDRRRGRTKLIRVIDTIRTGVPDGLEELALLGRTLHRRRAGVLTYFEYRASNGPTEAINGRLEALRRHALGFPNLLHYRIRSLLHCGNLTHVIDAL